MENLVNSIYALQVPLQGFVLIQMIVTDADKAVSGKPGNHMVQGFCFIIGKGQLSFLSAAISCNRSVRPVQLP